MHWSESEDKILRSLYCTSVPTCDLAASFGRSEDAVRLRAMHFHEYGVGLGLGKGQKLTLKK